MKIHKIIDTPENKAFHSLEKREFGKVDQMVI